MTASTPDPELGTIVRHGDGRPVGMLLEHGAMELVERHMPPISRATYERGLTEAMSALSAEGIVWAQDAVVELRRARRVHRRSAPWSAELSDQRRVQGGPAVVDAAAIRVCRRSRACSRQMPPRHRGSAPRR